MESETHYPMSPTSGDTSSSRHSADSHGCEALTVHSCGNSGPYQVTTLWSSTVGSSCVARPPASSPSSGENPRALALQSDSGLGPDIIGKTA